MIPLDEVQRPREQRDGSTVWERVTVCVCADRRGPRGGVCAACGAAIPSLDEITKHTTGVDR